jgi:hypothetical protein
MEVFFGPPHSPSYPAGLSPASLSPAPLFASSAGLPPLPPFPAEPPRRSAPSAYPSPGLRQPPCFRPTHPPCRLDSYAAFLYPLSSLVVTSFPSSRAPLHGSPPRPPRHPILRPALPTRLPSTLLPPSRIFPHRHPPVPLIVLPVHPATAYSANIPCLRLLCLSELTAGHCTKKPGNHFGRRVYTITRKASKLIFNALPSPSPVSDSTHQTIVGYTTRQGQSECHRPRPYSRPRRPGIAAARAYFPSDRTVED